MRWIRRLLAALLAAVVLLIVWCLIPLRPTMPALSPRPETRYWTMSRGYRIGYTRLAAPPGGAAAPVIFLHGGPGGYIHSSAIRAMAPIAAMGHDVYLYDQAGSGLSDRLARPKDYSFLGHVEDLREIVAKQIAADRVILIGHSYGGQLAAQLVAMHPERVERLVLSSPGELQPALFDEEGRWVNAAKYVPPASLRFTEPAVSEPMDGLRFWPMRVLATMALAAILNVKLMPDAEADAALNTLAARFTAGMVCDPGHVQPEEGGAGMYAHGWSNWYGDLEDPRPAMRRATLPVLVLQGECDYLPYAGAYEYEDLFPNARYDWIEGAGHILWWDRPEEFTKRIMEFLR